MTDPIDSDLEAVMADWIVPAPSAALRERIVASARTRRSPRGLWWAGAAGLGLAGAVTGAVVAILIAPPPFDVPGPAVGADILHAETTVFGDLDDGSEG